MLEDTATFLRLFEAEDFHAAHDALEPRWTVTRSRTLQGLIQLSVGWHHLTRGNAHGARVLWRKALAHLEATEGEQVEGVALEPLCDHLRLALASLPSGRRLDPDAFAIPPPRLTPLHTMLRTDLPRETIMYPTPDARVNDALHELEALKPTRDDLWNVSWDSGLFLRMLVLTSGARGVLEIGMSNGFSTLWLASAARENGGRVTALEQEPWKLEAAAASFDKAGLADVIEIRAGDAAATLDTLDGPFDFLFLDAWKPDYAAYLRAVAPMLRPGGIIAADNAASHAAEMAEFLEAVREGGVFDSVLVPIGNGIELSRKRLTQ